MYDAKMASLRTCMLATVVLGCGASTSGDGTSEGPGTTSSPSESSGPATTAGTSSSSSTTSSTTVAETSSSSSDDGGEGPKLDVGGVASESGGDTGPVDECPCHNVEDGIYVLHSTSPASVWFYDPPANTFTEVGMLGCMAPFGATANSMAIDREGNAWINYYTLGFPNDGLLFQASLDDLGSCYDQGYDANGEWFLLGMGFSVDVEGGSCDTLFLYDSDKYATMDFTGGSALARWDESSSALVDVGDSDYPVAELSGTGDARLFAFATVSAGETVLAELDKSDGSTIDMTPLDGLDITNAFAFAFWGGDVYFFTETFAGSGNSKVTRLDYDGNDGGGLDIVNANTGLHITGAGVSTCASFMPPG
jgi:hypothetical protein